MSGFVSLLNAGGDRFVVFAGRMLMQSSALIVVLVIVDLIVRRRIKAVVRYWIWLLVLVKLVLPPSLSSPTGLAYWVGDKLPALSPAAVRTPEGSEAVTTSVAEPIALAVPDGAVRAFPLAVDPVSPGRTPVSARPVEVAPAVASPVPVPTLTWRALALLAWLAIATVMILLLIQRAFFVRGLVAQSEGAPDWMAGLLDRCRTQMGVRRAIKLRLTAISASPSVCGLWRPTILVPHAMARQLDRQQLKSILLHELAHIRRGDLWVNLVQALLQIAYVYHPLLWLANAGIRKVREQAVDEMVLAAMGEEAEAYPQTLLTVSKLAFGRPALSLRLLGVVESKKALTARIRHIVSRPFPRSAKLGLVGLILVLIAAVVFLPMGRRSDKSADSEPGEQSIEPQFRATLSNGLTVGVLGVCEHPTSGKSWWAPDGENLVGQRPDDVTSSGPDYNRPDAHVKVFALELGGRPLRDVTLRWRLEAAPRSTFVPRYEDREKKLLRPVQAIVAAFPDDPAVADLRIGIAAGPWRFAAGGPPPDRGGGTNDSLFDRDVIWPEPTWQDGSLRVQAAHLIGSDYDCRIVARGPGGLVREPQTCTNTGGSDMHLCAARFDLAEDQIESFELQARPYEWVDFKEVRLMPKHTNDAGRTGGDPSVDSSGPRLAEARSVTGIVTDPLGRPRQCVRFAPDGESPRKEPMSDVQGRFTLEDVSPDQKTWLAYSHASRLYGLFTLPETAPAEPVNVILTLGEADLEGRVVGPDGKALAKQKVEIVASTAEGVRFVLGHRPETDAYGYYSHGNVPCGEGLTIQARLMGADGGDTAFSTVPLRTRANQFLIAMPVLVAARARIQPDFDRNMKDDGMLHCGGRVVDDAGRPIPNVRVRLSFDMPGWMSTWIREAATDERGHWHRPLPPECIDLRVTFEHPEYYPAASRGRPPREELTDGSYTVAMRRGLVLEGTVVDEQGEPVENALVCAERPRSFTPSPYNQINENSTMARTLRDGSFCIRGLSPGEKNVIVYSDYYAPVVQAVDVREGMAPACVTLSRGRTYRGRVVDVGGDPIENVRVGTQRWQSGTERYWMSRIGVTDTQGMFVLENLPAGQIELNVGKKGYLGFSMDLPHDASQVDQAVMYEVPVFTGRVLDADTNEPIRDFEIVNGICSSVDGSLDWSRFHRTHVEDANGAFTHQWGGWHLGYPMSYACCLKIEAQGYLAGVCSPIEFGKTCDPLTVRLEKGTPIVGTVLQADGGPAASAQLAFVRSGEKAYVDRDQFSASSFSYQAEIMTTADADGRFELPPTEVQGLIVAVHRSGYAQVQSADFKGGSAIRLTAWSRVEGVIDRARIDEKEIEIALYTLEENPDKQVPCIYWLLGRVTPTGETFALDCVPAVPLAVGRICRYEMHDATYFVPQPGQTYTIRIGAHGRAVAGRIVPPADASVAFTDPRRVHAVAFRTDGPGGIPAEITAIGQSSFTWLWRDKEDVYTPSTTQRKRFVPTIADDGSFTFNGLEPGRYEFLANAHAPLGENVSCGRGVLEAVAVSRFTVPDDRTTSTIRVPDIRLRTLTYPQVGEPAPLFEAEALDGATIRLADLRGKVVLLDFWATWCKPCVAQMPELQKLYEQFGARADFAMIGLSVDWDVEEARTLVAAKQLAWPQVCLGDMESSQVVKRYGIGGIPTAICVDAAGNIVARGTSLDQLRREIANALGDVH